MDGDPFLGNPRLVILLNGEVQVADGYVFVCNESVPNVLRARKVLLSIDKALDASSLRSVMFDTRAMAPPPEAVNALLRSWVDKCRYHDKVAILVKSDLKRIASNMRALSVGVKMRSFHDMAEAEKWLRRPLPRTRVEKPTAEARQAEDAPVRRERTLTEPIDMPIRRGRPVDAPGESPMRRERTVTEPIDLPIRRERTPTEPIDLPIRRERPFAKPSEAQPKRRWNSPLLQSLNED